MDSALSALARKGNLETAPASYNPQRCAQSVVHFTPFPDDAVHAAVFAPWNIQVFPYHDGRSNLFRPLTLARNLRTVVAKIKAERLNLVRGRLPYYGSLLGCLAARWLGLPSVVSLGGDNRLAQELTGDYHYGSRRLSYALEYVVLRLASALIAPNEFTVRYVASIIGEARARNKTVVIPWQVAQDVFEDSPPAAIDALGLRPDVPLVVTASFLNKYKHVDTLFDVVDGLLASPPGPVQFVFCGDGPLRPEGQARFAGRDTVKFPGWCDHRVVLALMRQASVVLVPMSGFVLLEAAALGKAVVTSDQEWHGEVVQDGENGFLVPPTDASRWIESARRLLADPELGRTMGARLAQTFQARYRPEAAIDREIALYTDLVARQRPPGPATGH